MRKFSMAEELLNVVKANAAANNAKKVVSVKLKVGNLSLITPEAISMSFKTVSKGTIAEGAALIIERMPVVVRCRRCGMEDAANIPEDVLNKIKNKDAREHKHLSLSSGYPAPKIYPLPEGFINCNNCSGRDFDIVSSDDIYLERVELDV